MLFLGLSHIQHAKAYVSADGGDCLWLVTCLPSRGRGSILSPEWGRWLMKFCWKQKFGYISFLELKLNLQLNPSCYLYQPHIMKQTSKQMSLFSCYNPKWKSSLFTRCTSMYLINRSSQRLQLVEYLYGCHLLQSRLTTPLTTYPP